MGEEVFNTISINVSQTLIAVWVNKLNKKDFEIY